VTLGEEQVMVELLIFAMKTNRVSTEYGLVNWEFNDEVKVFLFT
jgi:hypothetical protein